MSKLIPAAERLIRARQLIQKAREIPVPDEGGRNDLTYIAKVKDCFRQARDLIKFIPQSVTTTDETREEVKKIMAEIEQANQEILH